MKVRVAMCLSVLAATLACGDDESTGGDGGAGGTSAGGQAATGGSSQGGEGGIIVDVTPCGDPATPYETGCPAVCSGGCDGGVCTILCDEAQDCNAAIQCPPGLPCQVTCSGENSCRFQITCDKYYACGISCTAIGACTGLDVMCGELSECGISCVAGDACSGGSVMCGDGKCTSQCLGTGQPSVTCGDSCDCTSCT